MGRTNVSSITLQNHRILQKCLNTDTCRDIFRKFCILVYKMKKKWALLQETIQWHQNNKLVDNITGFVFSICLQHE